MLLYLHIPFCDSKCHYCSFNSYTNLGYLKESYMDALFKQLKQDIEIYKVKKGSIQTIFIGGGTPSTISTKLYKKIFNFIEPYMCQNIEITSEANPNSATKEWLKGMVDLGVNRFSFGVQSFNEKKLKVLNRSHSPYQAIKAVEDCYLLGVENISIDLMYGVAGDSKELLKQDLTIATQVPINHLSSYSLTIEENTFFSTKNYMSIDDENIARWFIELVQDRLFPQYEISNFGSYISKHNLGYWQHKEYLGIGSGAVGYIYGFRYYPHSDVTRYIKEPHFKSKENLSTKNIVDEKIFLGARSIVGIEKEILNTSQLQKAETLENKGKLESKDDRFYNKDYLISDEVALYIIE